jgi:hypothetical protein
MTRHYVGIKIVEAWEESRDGEPGYAVKYSDGYTSWSPKATFEEANLPLGHIGHLPPHVQRMKAEQVEVQSRIEKLDAFTQTKTFAELDAQDRGLLVIQASAMQAYYCALSLRLDRATSAQT